MEELVTFTACAKCHGRVDPLTPPSGRCARSECGVIVRIDKCKSQVSAKLLFEYGKDKRKEKSVHAYGEMLGRMTDKVVPEGVTSGDLIRMAKFKEIQLKNDVITGLVKETEV